jgi:hypothetical protein
MKVITVLALVLVLATSVYGLEKKAFQMREDFGTEPLYNCYMNYFYYVPCPTYSWFWAYTGWTAGDIIGTFFTVGDASMFTSTGCPPYTVCDPYIGHTLEQFRILDFGGYGTIYPGLFTVEFDIYCSDAFGCPVGASLWNSGPVEFCVGGWNYINVDPDLCITDCATEPNFGYPRILIAATMIGSDATYPAWGMDNISTPVEYPCVMHDYGCCPALYPRPGTSHYSTIHSGYYGPNFLYCPPAWFADGRDTSPNVDVYGFIELAWRIYVANSGPTATEPSTWGNIKSMYR